MARPGKAGKEAVTVIMRKRYEVRHSTGYVRGTKRQVSRWLRELEWGQLREEWHVRDVAVARAWDALPPSQQGAWREKERAWQAENPGGPEFPAHCQFEARLATAEWQRFIGSAAPRAPLPWIVHSDTDKAHRCPRCESMGGTGDEIKEHGHPSVNKRHVYQCTRCGQRFRNRAGLPDFDTGLPVWFPWFWWRQRWAWRHFAQDCKRRGLHGALWWQLTWEFPRAWKRHWRKIRRNWQRVKDAWQGGGEDG